MARVVQRRSNPPYLLIIFVFLFLIAAALAVLGFMGGDEIKQENVRKDIRISKLAEENDAMSDQLSELVLRVTGQSGTGVDAIRKADGAYDHPDYKALGGERGGLATELVNLAGTLKKQKAALASLNDVLAKRNDELAGKDAAITKLSAANAEKIKQLNDQKAKLEQALTAEKAARTTALKQADENLAATRAKLESEIKEKERQIETLVLQLQERDKKLARTQSDIDKLRKPRGKGDLVNKPDGQVEKVARNADVCYINLGSKDRVRAGTTFAVYGKRSSNKEDTKGRLVVTNVSRNFSECKIIQQEKDMPVVVGDNIANLAFDPVRSHVFVVKGLFDLHSTGTPGKYGAEEIKNAIRRFGGKVAEKLSIQTDYVVLGVEPTKPAKPAPDAPASVQRTYQQKMKWYKEYHNAKAEAGRMKIPMLNTNRFLIFTGYEPEKGPE